MIVKTGIRVADLTTFRMGGNIEKLYYPENLDDLKQLLNDEEKYYLIGGGSNIIANDKKTFKRVVSLTELDKNIKDEGEGNFVVGASVRLQHLIKHINNLGYGGIEYLYSVPGLVGGAVFMNAGRGKNYNQSISDFIVDVTVLEDGKIRTISKADCGFAYRTSAFQTLSAVIIKAHFCFPPGDKETFETKRRERMELVKAVQDNSAPNCGSIFSAADSRIIKLVRKLSGKKSGVRFSEKTNNWLLNQSGTYDEAAKLISRVETLHKIVHKPCRKEVILWD